MQFRTRYRVRESNEQKVPYMNKNNCCTRLAIVSLIFAGHVGRTQADVWTLTDGDSFVRVDDVAGSAYDWTVGTVDHLTHQWFYYRAGGAGFESPINSISAPSSYLNGANQLVTTYANAMLSVEVTFTLLDTLNPGESHFNQEVTVNNLSGSPLSLNLFQYSDYDLAGIADNDSVQMFAGSFNVRYAYQTEPGGQYLTETVNSSPSDGATTIRMEAALFDTTLASLTDASVTTLNNNLMSGPGNTTYTIEWERTLAAQGEQGSSIQLSKLQTVVPEPSSFALFSLAGGTLMLLRSRRQSEQS